MKKVLNKGKIKVGFLKGDVYETHTYNFACSNVVGSSLVLDSTGKA